MIIVGEKLNSSIPKTLAAINGNDEEYLIGLIKQQQECGAHYLDINTAICGGDELPKLLWLIELAMAHSDCGIMLDSPNPAVIQEAIKAVKGRKVIINSVTLADRIDELLPTVKAYGAGVVALPIDGVGIPETVEKRVANASLLIEKITAFGIDIDNIYIDVLAEALAMGNENAMTAVNTIKGVKAAYPQVHTICGLSNISFGLPQRANINAAFLTAAVLNGLDSVIMDITSHKMKAAMYASLAVCGQDDYCMEYIGAIREMG